jgi:polyisoprenyl-phosphate glycosyltransferase
MPKISILIPCYFNEGNIPVTGETLIQNEVSFPADVSFEYIFVDDGSKDKTWEAIETLKEKYPEKIVAIKLAANVGTHYALLAAVHHATGDCGVIFAADLQDPPELIPKMYDYWVKGIKFVIANRVDREESLGQKLFANTYHYLIRKLALQNIPENGFDLVLFDRQIIDEIKTMSEKNTHIIYLMAWLGYDYVAIPYTRRKREIGKSRWTLKKKVKLFLDSFVSFSFFPIRAISVTGLLLGSIALIYALVVIVSKLLGLGGEVQGWTSLMLVILFVSSFQMIGLGIIGEYVWRTLDAARNRPSYVIEKLKK